MKSRTSCDYIQHRARQQHAQTIRCSHKLSVFETSYISFARHGLALTHSAHLNHTVVMIDIKPTVQPDAPNTPNSDCGPAIPNAQRQTMAKTRVPDRYKKSININKRLTLSPLSKYIPPSLRRVYIVREKLLTELLWRPQKDIRGWYVFRLCFRIR